MKHVDLKPTLGKTLTAAKSTPARATQPHGVKVMTDGEDTKWTDADGTVHSVRELPASLAALADELEAGVSTASRANTVSTEPAPASTTGYPAGAFWTRVEMIDGDLVARERWTVIDGTWTPVGLDASTLVTGTVDAGLIDAVALAARMITAGLIRTSATGQRVELTSDGLILWLVDADGVEREGVRIGPTGAQLITVGEVTIAPGSVTAPTVNAGALTIGGRALANYVDIRIRSEGARLVAIGGGGGSGATFTTADGGAETGVFDVIVPGVRKDAWYRAILDLTAYPAGQDVEASASLRYAPMPQGVMTNSPLLGTRRLGVVRASEWDHKTAMFWIPGSAFTLATEGGAVRLLLTVSGKGRTVKVNGDTTLGIYLDTIPKIPFSSTINRGGAPQPSSTTATPQAPVTQVQTYVKTYSASSSTTYYDSDNRVDSYTGGGTVVQGSYNGSASTTRHGAWWFPDMTADTAGSTITNVEIYVRNESTYSSSGGTGHFYAHNGTNSVGGNIMNAAFTRGQDRWLQIPSMYWDAVKNGQMRGFMAAAQSNSTSDYARWVGGAGSAQIRIAYQK